MGEDDGWESCKRGELRLLRPEREGQERELVKTQHLAVSLL